MQDAVKNVSIKKNVRKGAEWIMFFQVFDGWVTEITTFAQVAELSMQSQK